MFRVYFILTVSLLVPFPTSARSSSGSGFHEELPSNTYRPKYSDERFEIDAKGNVKERLASDPAVSNRLCKFRQSRQSLSAI